MRLIIRYEHRSRVENMCCTWFVWKCEQETEKRRIKEREDVKVGELIDVVCRRDVGERDAHDASTYGSQRTHSSWRMKRTDD